MKSTSVVWILLALLIPLSGCGGGDDGRVDVSGSVTLDGKPVEGALLAFMGGGGGALATASTDKAGKFQVRAAVGANKVTVSKEEFDASKQSAPKTDEEMTMGTDAQYREQLKLKPKSLVPAKYASPETSGLSYDIARGWHPSRSVSQPNKRLLAKLCHLS